MVAAQPLRASSRAGTVNTPGSSDSNKELSNVTLKIRQQRRAQHILLEQRRDQTQRGLLTPKHLDLSPPPIYDPVFLHAVLRVELELGLTVAALAGRARRQHLDGDLRRGVQMALRSKRCRETSMADPDHIWHDICIRSEDQTGRDIRNASICSFAPFAYMTTYLTADELVMPVRLLRDMQFAIDDLVALAIVGQRLKISGCPA